MKSDILNRSERGHARRMVFIKGAFGLPFTA